MDYAAARHNMIEGQVRPNAVTDPAVLDALSTTPRELYIPKRLEAAAYAEDSLRIGGGRVVMAPMVIARMLQECAIKKTDAVLEIAAGLGYCTSLLAQLASAVIAIETDASRVKQAAAILSAENVHNAAVLEGSLAEGCAKHGPYDVVFINGAIETTPNILLGQLAEGGRLVAVVRDRGHGTATLFKKDHAHIGKRPLFDVAVPPLPEFARDIGGFAF